MAIVIQDVRDILPAYTASTISDDAITAAIEASQCLLGQFAGSFCGETFSDTCLDRIHTYLAAHFLSCTEPTLNISKESSDECCRSTIDYGWIFGTGILSSPYGIMANSMSGGCLQEYDKQPANIWSIGSHGGSAGDYYN